MNADIDDLKPYILCRYAADSSLYSSWIDQLPGGFEIVEQCPTDFSPPKNCGIVITHEHYRWEEQSCLRRIQEAGTVPTLVLADGVLEYRNTWENPTIPDGSMYQPLFADKIACIGMRSARMIESWGNPGTTEVVGLPRLDSIARREKNDHRSNSEFRLLVCTATTPAFNDEQYATVLDSLKALKTATDAGGQIQGKKLIVIWRLTAGLDQAIGLPKEENVRPLVEEMEACDAVVTTPSTIMLESMWVGKPTAVLDFSNSPQFVTAAWNILAESHIGPVLEELSTPNPAKLQFQAFNLNENLQCQVPATPRLLKLIDEMITIGQVCRSDHKRVSFPSRILDPVDAKPTFVDALDDTQPAMNHLQYEQQELRRLQAELNQAVHRLGSAPRELAEKNNQISQLQDALDESRRRVADVRARLFKLRKILGIGKENQGEG